MRIRNKDFLLYACIIIFSVLHLSYFLSSYISTDMNNTDIVIPILDVVFMTMGLIYLGIAAMMALGMWKYYIGKLFSMQLFLIAVALLAILYIGDMTRFPMNVLLIASNLCLFCVIARLTGLHQGKLFKSLIIMHIILSGAQVVINVIVIPKRNGDSLLFSNYIVTFLMVLILLVCNYTKVSVHSKKQIKSLIKSLTIGILLYIILSVVNILEISPSYENKFKLEQYVIMVEESEEGQETFLGIQLNRNPSLPVIVFTIVIYRIFFILIKKEYFASEVAFWINKIVKSIILLMILNLFIALYFMGSVEAGFMINGILIWTMFSNNYISSVGSKSQKEMVIMEEDKHTLAMHLHDEILQDLFAIKNTVNIDSNVEEKLTILVGKIRNLSNDLFPLIVENVGLNRSFQIYIDELRRAHNIEFDYEFICLHNVIELHLEIALYRSVKELVNNAIKHANATVISIVIDSEKNVLCATVRDNGKGFEVPEISELILRKSMGLYSIYKQSRDFGGQFMLYSSLDNGTECIIKLPL